MEVKDENQHLENNESRSFSCGEKSEENIFLQKKKNEAKIKDGSKDNLPEKQLDLLLRSKEKGFKEVRINLLEGRS